MLMDQEFAWATVGLKARIERADKLPTGADPTMAKAKWVAIPLADPADQDNHERNTRS